MTQLALLVGLLMVSDGSATGWAACCDAGVHDWQTGPGEQELYNPLNNQHPDIRE